MLPLIIGSLLEIIGSLFEIIGSLFESATNKAGLLSALSRSFYLVLVRACNTEFGFRNSQ